MQWQDPISFAILLACFIGLLFSFMLLIVWQGKKYINRVKKEEANKRRILKAHQQQLAQSAILSMEKERNRIAADLHDALVGNLRRILLLNKDEHLKKEIKHAIHTARDISHDLMPPMLEHLPMEELIIHLVQPLQDAYSIHLESQESTPLDPEVKLHVYRILQELISNVLTHAKANDIFIHFSNTPSLLSLTFKDNGIGFKEGKKQGIGMQNIEMRCQLIQASCSFNPNTPQGSRFELHKTL